MQNNTNKWLIGGLVGVLLLCLCVGSVCLLGGGLALIPMARSLGQLTPEVILTQMATRVATFEVFPNDATPEPLSTRELNLETPSGPTGTPPALDQQTPAGQEAQETLNTLENMIVPINDPRELATRLEGIQNIPATMEAPKEPLKTGAKQTFWASNVETNENFQVSATLQYITGHLYFWVEDGVRFNNGALKRLADTFESKIYPTDREFFGSEWTPGIDNDPHLYVLYARGLGSSIAGYFSSADELPPQAHKYSNAHEMFLMSADNVRLEEEYIYGVMAHEFQHMIHWHGDRNEESWMNEGFSVVAEFLNGYDLGGFDTLYLTNPDLQLTYWPSPPDATPHYGESFLFLAYYLDRFGDKATQALVADPDNGMDSVDKVLKSLNQTDAETGKVMTADELFADWAVTSYVNDPKVGDGRYAYKRYTGASKPAVADKVTDCSPDWQSGSVHQYGVDYIQITCSGSFNLQFRGATEVGVLPVNAHSGSYAFWSNKGDESDMTLTREFDFSQASGPLTLKYSTWYDVEKDYDYVYLDASADGGKTWQILKTPSGRDKSEDPSGNAYGWGYNDKSNNWIQESVDLSQFAGKKVLIRFEYVTDAAVNGEGFMVDDVQVPEINYSDDFEKGDGGWEGKGFVRIQNRLPQEYRVSIIQEGKTTSVQHVTLDENNTASIPLKFGSDMRDAVLVISGVTRFTTQEASYQFSFQK